MNNQKPKLYIFAGANGAGKTTAAEYLLPRLKIKEFVNADEIARGLSPFNPTGQAISAGKLVLKRTHELIGKKQTFAIETTLSGNHLEKIIREAHKAGFLVEMHYIFCADLRVNLARIKNRVKQGGHHVPADDVRRRYWRSLRNFLDVYCALCDKITIYDTTNGEPEEIMKSEEIGVFSVYNLERSDIFWAKVEDARRKKD